MRRSRSILRKRPDVDFQRAPAEGCLDVRVSAESLDRALRVMEALLKTVESRQYRVEVSTPKPEPDGTRPRETFSVTRVRIGEEWVEFGVEEAYDSIEIPPPPRASSQWWRPAPERERLPNGRLKLVIRNAPTGHRQTWADGKRQSVEACLGTFVRALETAAEGRRLQRLERERCAREEAERYRQWLAAERRRRHTEGLVRDIQERLQHWQLAKQVRELPDAAASATQTDAPSDALAAWLSWARG